MAKDNNQQQQGAQGAQGGRDGGQGGRDGGQGGRDGGRGGRRGAPAREPRSKLYDEEVIRINPEAINAYYNVGTAYAMLGQYQRAIDSQKEVIAMGILRYQRRS